MQGMLETDETDPVVFSLLRDALAWPIMHGLALAEHPLPGRTRAKALLPAPVDAPRIVLQGVVGVAFNQVKSAKRRYERVWEGVELEEELGDPMSDGL